MTTCAEIAYQAWSDATKAERERCLKVLNPSTQQLLLAAGEMSAQELRTVKAILKWMRHRIEEGTLPDMPS